MSEPAKRSLEASSDSLSAGPKRLKSSDAKPAPQDCNKELSPNYNAFYKDSTQEFVNTYEVSHQRIVRLNDEEYAVFGNFSFPAKADKLPFVNHENGFQLIPLSTAYSSFNTLLQDSFDLDIPRVCHVLTLGLTTPLLYVTDNGLVTEGSGNSSIFYATSEKTFSPAAVLEPTDVVTDFKLLRTGSEVNYIIYCAVKIEDTWFPVDLCQMSMNASARKLFFDYLRPKEKSGMVATMANYMYTRKEKVLGDYPEWAAGVYTRNSSVKKGDVFYTNSYDTDKVPPELPWKPVYPNTILEYTFNLPLGENPLVLEKLKFPAWTNRAHHKHDIVEKDGNMFRAKEATVTEPPGADWEHVHPAKGKCTGKASLISYALIRADTKTFMGGADRPWKLALGKANWFEDNRPGQFVPVTNLAHEPHWMYVEGVSLNTDIQ